MGPYERRCSSLLTREKSNEALLRFDGTYGVFLALGELGRSTRLVNVARSVAIDHPNECVYLMGYFEEFPLNEKLPDNVVIAPIPIYVGTVLPGVLQIFMKAIYLMFYVFMNLSIVTSTKFVYVQNPPALPALMAIKLLKMFRYYGCEDPTVILDWHNLGFTCSPPSRSSFLVLLYEYCELWLGRSVPDKHIAVSQAMKHYLQADLGIPRSNTFLQYDETLPRENVCEEGNTHNNSSTRQTDFFQFAMEPFLKRTSALSSKWQKHPEMAELSFIINPLIAKEKTVGTISLVMSSSFTWDEDISPLVQAMKQIDFDLSLKKNVNKPLIQVLVTGDGPDRGTFNSMIEEHNWHFVSWFTGYLRSADYWWALEHADVGLSLFKSSSGLDIPMKAHDLVAAKTKINLYWDYGVPMEEFLRRVSSPYGGKVSSENYSWIVLKDDKALVRCLLGLIIDPPTSNVDHERMKKEFGAEVLNYRENYVFEDEIKELFRTLIH